MLDGWQEIRDQELRTQAENVRLLNFFQVRMHADPKKAPSTPDKLYRFPWEKQKDIVMKWSKEEKERRARIWQMQSED
jgi:hypothetical protein